MKRKYYLRGLGLGILITSIVFILAGPSELSEEEVIKRAEELGYSKTEQQEAATIDLKELMQTGTPTPTIITEQPVSNTPVPTMEVTTVPTVSPTETPKPTDIPTPTPSPEPTPITAPTATPTPEPTPTKKPEASVKKATIVVERGNTASVVCEKIEKAGILKDGDKLKDYLIKNNLTDYINVGSFDLSSDMSLKEIAKVLTGR